MRNHSRPSAAGILSAATVVVALATPVASVFAGPVASFSRSVVSFGNMPSGVVSSTQPVFVTNTGDAPLTIAGSTITGVNAAAFGVAGTCAPSTILPPSARCRLDFVMQSGGEGKRQAAFSLQSDAAPQPADIMLTAIMDNLGPYLPPQPSPPWIDFGNQALGTPAPTQTLTLANNGSLNLTILTAAFNSGDIGDFTLSTTCIVGAVFAATHNCDATIGFMPSVNGPRSTEFLITLRAGSPTGLSATGTYQFSVTGIGGTAGAAPTVTVVEFYNMGLDHYFITYGAQEISDLDTGVHKGWARTGYSFKAYTTAQSGTSPVCRFYIPPALGDSHFFGRGTAECNATGQKNPTFVNEDPAFMQMFLPVAGVCPASTTEIYRAFSNRPDANHRYMTDKTVRDAMVVKGWLAEGDGPNLVVMCAPA